MIYLVLSEHVKPWNMASEYEITQPLTLLKKPIVGPFQIILKGQGLKAIEAYIRMNHDSLKMVVSCTGIASPVSAAFTGHGEIISPTILVPCMCFYVARPQKQ